jgi:hypothetical protein
MRRVAPVEFDLDAIMALPEDQRFAELKRIEAYRDLCKRNPLWAFRPHEGEKQRKTEDGEALTGEESRGQVELLECNQRDVYIGAVVAGNRFGKSHIAAVDSLIQTLPPGFVPPWLEIYRRLPYNGERRIRIVVPDEPQALKKVWLPKLRKLVPGEALQGGSFEKAWNSKDRQLRFADESWWDFMTHNMDVDAFSGADLDRVHFDEEPPGELGKQQWEESEARLIDRHGDIRFTGTPLFGYTWLFYELTSNDVPRRDDEVYVVEGAIDDNPALPAEDVERQIRRWAKKDPGRMEARRRGRFVHFAGLIYPEFRETAPPSGHVCPDRPIPRKHEQALPSVPIYECFDPGIDHPAALVYFWLDEKDVAEVFFAYKERDLKLADLVDKRNDILEALSFRPRWTVIDPASRNRNPATGRNMQDVLLRDHGVATIPGNNVVNPGLNEVRTRLSTGRLVIHQSCEQLLDEFRSYRYKNRKRTQTEDEPKLEPIKKNDDLLDALRYGLMSLPTAAKPDKPQEDLSDPRRRLLVQDLRRRLSKKGQRVGSVAGR